MWEIVGGAVRYRDLVAKIKIAKFFPGVFVGDSRNLCSRKFPAIRYYIFEVILIGASLSEPHTSESNGGVFIYILYICRTYVFRKCKFNSFNPNFAHADPCG